MKKRLGTIVANRRLSIVGDKEVKVLVKIGKPRRTSGGDWLCPFHIQGLGASVTEYAHGGDALQALLLAVESLKKSLEESGKRFQWIGGEPGDHGIPRCVPLFFGLEFARKLEKFIDTETDHLGQLIQEKGLRYPAISVPDERSPCSHQSRKRGGRAGSAPH